MIAGITATPAAMTDSPSPSPKPPAAPPGRRSDAPPLRSAAVAFLEIRRTMAADSLRSDPHDPVRLDAAVEPLMRAVLARYGFERAPATWAELYALFEYCDKLDAASGVGMRPADQLAEWQAASFVVWRRKEPALMPAIERYCAGEIDALAALHREEDTLTRLGRDYLHPETDT